MLNHPTGMMKIRGVMARKGDTPAGECFENITAEMALKQNQRALIEGHKLIAIRFKEDTPRSRRTRLPLKQ